MKCFFYEEDGSLKMEVIEVTSKLFIIFKKLIPYDNRQKS